MSFNRTQHVFISGWLATAASLVAARLVMPAPISLLDGIASVLVACTPAFAFTHPFFTPRFGRLSQPLAMVGR